MTAKNFLELLVRAGILFGSVINVKKVLQIANYVLHINFACSVIKVQVINACNMIIKNVDKTAQLFQEIIMLITFLILMNQSQQA